MRLHDLLDFRAREQPDAPFGEQGGRRLSFAEAAADSLRIANGLVGGGLNPGDRVAILAKNSLDYVCLYFGAARAGVVPVPLNYRLAPAEWAYIAGDAGARALFAAAPFLEPVDTIRHDLPTVERFVAVGGDGRGGWDDYSGWLAAQPTTAPATDAADDDDAIQMYTSGTTGRPKGAVLTHGNLTTMVGGSAFLGLVAPGERHLIVCPMYHIAAVVPGFITVAAGGCIVVHEDFAPHAVVDALSAGAIGSTLLVPAMIQACLAFVPDVAERPYDRLRCLAYGASPIAESTLRRAMAVFGCDFMQVYGMTETSGSGTALLPADHRRALNDRPELLQSAGRSTMLTQVRVVDAFDRPLPPGEMGEIVIRGSANMRGYWNMGEASADALRGGWMHTGDAGTIDGDGYIYVKDRIRDMIVSGGENVYPRVVEDVLFAHPAVADAAVIGVPDDQWGETVKAVVVLKPGAAASAADLIEHCRGRLGGFERPRSVDFVDALPRNPSGKVLKRQLREPYWVGHTRRVGGA